jgi:anti-sigma B factor antagonist
VPHDSHASNNGSAVHDDVVMHGRITIENSGEMRRMLRDALRAKPATVSVDLSDVSYIDTSGLATLVEAVRIARKQGMRLILVGMKDQPHYLFEIIHLDRFFDTPAPEVNT